MHNTIEEIRLSRELANEIQWVIDMGGVVPVQIIRRYYDLKKFYDRQIHNEEYTETTDRAKNHE